MQLSLVQIGKWLDCPVSQDGFVLGYKQDSRLVEEGDLFFAIQGEKVDGHVYLKEVAKKGALAAVVSAAYSGDDFGLRLFRVEDVRAALRRLAEQVHQQYPCRVIGVTGSVGKTTAKEFIAELLGGCFRVNKTPGNANSQVGMPLSLLNAKGDEEVFVAEMGMSQPGEIARLVAIAPPEIALITKIASSHVAFFADGLQGIALAKGEILSSPKMRLSVMNAQVVPFFSSVKEVSSNLIYGVGEELSDFKLRKAVEGYWVS